MSKDLNSNILVKPALAPAATTGDRTSSAIDVSGAESITLAVHVGAITTLDGTNKLTLSALFGDSSSGGGVAADSGAYTNGKDSDGDSWDLILDASAEANHTYLVQVENRTLKKYVELKLTAASSPSAIIGAQVILGDLRRAPN